MNTCIIILDLSSEVGSLIIGILADSVKDVVEFGPSEMQPPPRIGSGLDSQFIQAMARQDDGFVIILDIDLIFSREEIRLLGVHSEKKDGTGEYVLDEGLSEQNA